MGFPDSSLVKNPPAVQETPVQLLGWEDPLEKGKATHSRILAWRIPWTYSPRGRKGLETPGRLPLSCFQAPGWHQEQVAWQEVGSSARCATSASHPTPPWGPGFSLAQRRPGAQRHPGSATADAAQPLSPFALRCCPSSSL